MQASVLRTEAMIFKVVGMATTKDMTTPKHGAKRCRVTFRMETNVPRSFPVNKTNTKGKNSCIVSSESQSILSNHRRNDEPKAKIKARFFLAASFRVRRAVLLASELIFATETLEVTAPSTCSVLEHRNSQKHTNTTQKPTCKDKRHAHRWPPNQ